MKIRVISDVHGRDIWKQGVKDIDHLDLVLFLGDYVDSFDIPSSTILYNLNEIIDLKKQYPEKVILLHGNHDLCQYYLSIKSASGFRSDMYHDLYAVFSENYKLFQTAYCYKNYLFTHAGVTLKWLEQADIDSKLPLQEIVNQINDLTETGKGLQKLLDVSYSRGGYKPAGSCIWNDINDTIPNGMLPDVVQIFGHSKVPEIEVEYVNDTTYYYAVDCHGTKPDFLTLNLK